MIWGKDNDSFRDNIYQYHRSRQHAMDERLSFFHFFIVFFLELFLELVNHKTFLWPRGPRNPVWLQGNSVADWI